MVKLLNVVTCHLTQYHGGCSSFVVRHSLLGVYNVLVPVCNDNPNVLCDPHSCNCGIGQCPHNRPPTGHWSVTLHARFIYATSLHASMQHHHASLYNVQGNRCQSSAHRQRQRNVGTYVDKMNISASKIVSSCFSGRRGLTLQEQEAGQSMRRACWIQKLGDYELVRRSWRSREENNNKGADFNVSSSTRCGKLLFWAGGNNEVCFCNA